MPLYEYHCSDCGAEFEAIVSFKNADAVACERCGGAHVERLASAFACTAPSAGGSGAPTCPMGGGG